MTLATTTAPTACAQDAGANQPLHFHPRGPAPSAMAAEGQGWSVQAVQDLLDLPFMELLWRAQAAHRAHWPEGDVELATLLSVKTGGCPENCGYCPQSAAFDTGVKGQKLMEAEEVVRAAQAAKDAGATRFCMGAAWRAPKDRDIEKMSELISAEIGRASCRERVCLYV